MEAVIAVLFPWLKHQQKSPFKRTDSNQAPNLPSEVKLGPEITELVFEKDNCLGKAHVSNLYLLAFDNI